mgnify:CR=1 FL=1
MNLEKQLHAEDIVKEYFIDAEVEIKGEKYIIKYRCFQMRDGTIISKKEYTGKYTKDGELI